MRLATIYTKNILPAIPMRGEPGPMRVLNCPGEVSHALGMRWSPVWFDGSLRLIEVPMPTVFTAIGILHI